MAAARRTAGGFLPALPLLAALVVVAAYAGLLPTGKWQGDDYLLAWFVRRDGWHFLLDRLAGTSPRPVGETLAWLYLRVSNALDRPLIGVFLGVLWFAALVGLWAAGAAARVRRPIELALLLFALTLLLGRPGEMFYWPTGAAAYLPCWAALGAATVLHRAPAPGNAWALALALSTAAFSAEMGALTVLFYAVPAILLHRRDHARLIATMVAALAALAVCLVVLRQRMEAMNEVLDPASGFAGHWGRSLRVALPDFAGEAAGVAGLPLAAGVAVKLLLVVCLPAADREPARRQAVLTVVWAAALLAGAFASIVLAYHQFGSLCCERHATLRQGMVLLALVSLSGLLLGGVWLAPRRIALVGIVIGLLGLRAAPLATAWAEAGKSLAARRLTWASGNGPGDAMTLFLAPADPIANGDALPPGQYRRASDQPVGDTPWYAWGVMARFDKHALRIVPYDR